MVGAIANGWIGPCRSGRTRSLDESCRASKTRDGVSGADQLAPISLALAATLLCPDPGEADSNVQAGTNSDKRPACLGNLETRRTQHKKAGESDRP